MACLWICVLIVGAVSSTCHAPMCPFTPPVYVPCRVWCRVVCVDCGRSLGRAHDSPGPLSLSFPYILPRGVARKPFNAITLLTTHIVQKKVVLREMSSVFVFPRSATMPALSGHRLPFADPDTVVPAAGQTFQQR